MALKDPSDLFALAGSAVLEARERVRSALRNSGFEIPVRRITVNLAPERPTQHVDENSCAARHGIGLRRC